MKTVTTKNHFFNYNHYKNLCAKFITSFLLRCQLQQYGLSLSLLSEKIHESLNFRRSSSLKSAWLSLVNRLNTTASLFTKFWFQSMGDLSLCSALVCREAFAGVVALIQSVQAKATKRVIAGLVIMYVIAPLTYSIYYWFDRSTSIEGWFYYNWWHFFFTLRFQAAFLIFLIGIYVASPESVLTKIILAPAIAFLIMSILITVQSSSNDDMYDVFDLTLFGAGLFLTVTLFIGIDHFTWVFNHKELGFVQRMNNITTHFDDFTPEKIASMYKTAWLEHRKVQSQL